MAKSMKPCKRCQKPFDPEETRSELAIRFKMEPNFCVNCMLRNIMDVLDMPTPPDMIDPYTKHPALTSEEFNRMLKR